MAETKTLTDAAGRKITFKALSILEQARLYKAIGPAQAENGPYTRLANIAASVLDIDGVPRIAPRTPAEVDAAIGALGDDGYMALVVEAERMEAQARAAAEAVPQPGAVAGN